MKTIGAMMLLFKSGSLTTHRCRLMETYIERWISKDVDHEPYGASGDLPRRCRHVFSEAKHMIEQ